MKNTQLRTGNLVSSNYETKTIDGILRGHVCFTEDITVVDNKDKYGEWVSLDNVEFILLNEDWLLKLGFKRESVRMLPNKFHYANGGPISFYSSDTAIKVYGVYIYNIKYVHQLQNLHFALTGEELTRK